MTEKEAYEISKNHKEHLVNQKIKMIDEQIKDATDIIEYLLKNNVKAFDLLKELDDELTNHNYIKIHSYLHDKIRDVFNEYKEKK